MLKLVSAIRDGIANTIERVTSKITPQKSNKTSSNLINPHRSEDSQVELDTNFDDSVSKEYEYGSWNKTKRHADNGQFDADSIQGSIGDCGLMSTLRALRNSENGQKALSDVMSYNPEKGEWSFKFKTKDFTEGGASPIVVTKDEIDQAIADKRASKGDDDVTAAELAIEKYFKQIGRDSENNTQDGIVKQIVDIQNRARDKRTAAGMEDKGYLNGVSPYVAYVFTGKVPESLNVYEPSEKQKAQEYLENFDAKTDMIVFSQINTAGVANSGGDNSFTMIGNSQVLQNHAYTVCSVDGDKVTLRESNNPSGTIVVTIDELLNCEGNNSFYASVIDDN